MPAVIVFAAVVFFAAHYMMATGSPTHAGPIAEATSSGAPAVPTSPPVGEAGEYSIVQEPQAGFSGLYAQTAAATRSIDVEMYELSDVREEALLAAAVQRHVQVRVILDAAFHGKQANEAAYEYLTGHGVPVKWAPAGTIFHIKTVTFDGTVSDVSTGNLTSKYYSSTWDATVIDRNPTHVAEIDATFAHDWVGVASAAATVQAAGLVWSPGATDTMVSAIARAQHTVDFSSEELADPATYNALAQDARHGVTCNILMTASTDAVPGLTTAADAGCRVHLFPDSSKALYVHEKQILTDPGTTTAAVVIGSQNASVTSLTRNRELSLQLTAAEAPTVLEQLARTYATTFAQATTWTPGR